MPNCIINNGHKTYCGKNVENAFAFQSISDARKSVLFFGKAIDLCSDCLSAEKEMADDDAAKAQ